MLGVLVAAAAGGLLSLARPDTAAVGIGALALLPLAALALAGPARAVAITAMLAHVGVLIWAYQAYFAPLYAYSGLIDAGPETSAILVAAIFTALPSTWLPLSARRPSTIVLWALYLLGYLPSIVVSLMIRGDLEAVLPFHLALLGSMAIASLILRLPPPRLTVPQLSPTTFTRLMVALGVLSAAYVALNFGVRSPPSLGDVYTTRSEFGAELAGAAAGGYIVPWAANAINPIIMALGLARRRVELVLLGLAGQVLVYSVSGFKSVLFSIALVPLVYFAIAWRSRQFGLVAAVLVPLILVTAILVNPLTGDWSLSLARRTYATPGQIAWYYYDYFSVHPHYQLSHSFLRWLVPSKYSVDPPVLIGSTYFPDDSPNANGAFWADAFANFGVAGIIVFTVVFALVMWVVDGLARNRDARVAAPMLAIVGLSLGSSALFTTFLTLGLGVGCVLMALMPPASARTAQAPKGSPPTRPPPVARSSAP